MKRNNTDALAHSWQSNAAAWTRAVREGQIESRRAATDAAVVDALLRLAPARVLDVGCGEGWLCRALSGHGVEATGIDGSVALIDAAQTLGGGQFIVASYQSIAADPSCLPAAHFDAVVCNFALFEQEISPLLSALTYCLRPQGSLLIQTIHPFAGDASTPYCDAWRSEDFSVLGEGFTEAMPWYFRTSASWFSALTSAGWRLTGLAEPVHPTTGKALSLLLTAMRASEKHTWPAKQAARDLSPSNDTADLNSQHLTRDICTMAKKKSNIIAFTNPHEQILTIKVTLRGAKPQIWRRVQVRAAYTLTDFHYVIQTAMGWENAHLHVFHFGKRTFSIPMEDEWEDSRDENSDTVTLAKLGLAKEGAKLSYTYDFGDYWEHDIIVEGVGKANKTLRYPRCVKAVRACPPEDCGGLLGYRRLVRIMKNPQHSEHTETLDWIGDEFDPKFVNLDEINENLAVEFTA